MMMMMMVTMMIMVAICERLVIIFLLLSPLWFAFTFPPLRPCLVTFLQFSSNIHLLLPQPQQPAGDAVGET